MGDQRLNLGAGATLHGTYVLEAPLGRGGMGAVWRARHARLPRPVAIKVLHEHAYESEELLLRFRREAEITSQLGHPHIVEVFDFNVLEDGRAYLVMELLEGQSLRDRLRASSPLTLTEIVAVLDQVSSALAHAHRAGVVHRDLKPENIFLVGADRPGAPIHAKVLDFGISKMHGAHTVITQGASLMGTPRYMSPEQAQGDNAQVDGRADQFSVGAIAYELITGEPAFAGNSVTQVLLQVLQQEPARLEQRVPDLPTSVARAVTRALSKHREDRFEDLDAFRRVLLETEVDGTPGAVLAAPRLVSAAPTDPEAVEDTVRRPSLEPRPTANSPAPARTRRAAWVGLGALLLAAGAAGAWWQVRGGSGGGGAAVLPAGLDAGALGVAPDAGALGVADSTVLAAGAVVDAGASDLAGSETSDAGATETLDAAEPDLSVTDLVDAGTAPRPRRPVRPRPLPPRLEGAEAALRGGRFDEAIRLANRSLREEDDARAHAVAAIAYCGKRDLAAAKARLRQTPRRDRARVRRACARLKLDLFP